MDCCTSQCFEDPQTDRTLWTQCFTKCSEAETKTKEKPKVLDVGSTWTVSKNLCSRTSVSFLASIRLIGTQGWPTSCLGSVTVQWGYPYHFDSSLSPVCGHDHPADAELQAWQASLCYYGYMHAHRAQTLSHTQPHPPFLPSYWVGSVIKALSSSSAAVSSPRGCSAQSDSVLFPGAASEPGKDILKIRSNGNNTQWDSLL